MPFSSGDPNAFLALGMQSGLGTPQSTPAKFRFAKYLAGNSWDVQIGVQDIREGGDGLYYGTTYKQSQKTTGQIVVNLRNEIGGQMLSQIIGGATWDGGSAPAVHTFFAGHASFPWSTIIVAHPGTSLVHQLSDVRFTGLSLETGAGMPFKFTMPFTAITHGASNTALSAPTYYGDPLYVYHTGGSYQVDGAADTTVESFKVDVTYNTEEIQAQSISLDENPVMNADVNFEFSRRYENSTLWKKINMGAQVSPTTSVATGSFRMTNTFGASGVYEMFLPLLTYRQDSLTELDPDGKIIHETFTAKALKGATWPMILKLTNLHASAYSS